MRFNSYLHFNGQCEEAFKFYEKILDGKIDGLFRYDAAPGAEGQKVPADWRNKIMHGCMTIGDQVLMGMDAPAERFHKPQGSHVNVAIDNVAQGKKIFDGLSERGTVTMPFGPTFWAAGFGMVTDRFGIPWMVNCEKAA